MTENKTPAEQWMEAKAETEASDEKLSSIYDLIRAHVVAWKEARGEEKFWGSQERDEKESFMFSILNALWTRIYYRPFTQENLSLEDSREILKEALSYARGEAAARKSQHDRD